MLRMTAPSYRLGCAGWSIASMHAGLFGDGESMLARYATRLNCAEINSSFYRPHKPETYARWAAQVPATFRFSVKLPKAITHDARLRAPARPIAQFGDEVAGLGRRLGGVLVQLPPSLKYDRRTALRFFEALRNRFREPICCEPRHASWFEPVLEPVWKEYRIARVGADPARVPEAAIAAGAGAWRYWRLHGSPQIYSSRYSDAALQALAVEMRRQVRARCSAWCIFDNTMHGHSIPDALRLQALLTGDTDAFARIGEYALEAERLRQSRR